MSSRTARTYTYQVFFKADTDIKSYSERIAKIQEDADRWVSTIETIKESFTFDVTDQLKKAVNENLKMEILSLEKITGELSEQVNEIRNAVFLLLGESNQLVIKMFKAFDPESKAYIQPGERINDILLKRFEEREKEINEKIKDSLEKLTRSRTLAPFDIGEEQDIEKLFAQEKGNITGIEDAFFSRKIMSPLDFITGVEKEMGSINKFFRDKFKQDLLRYDKFIDKYFSHSRTKGTFDPLFEELAVLKDKLKPYYERQNKIKEQRSYIYANPNDPKIHLRKMNLGKSQKALERMKVEYDKIESEFNNLLSEITNKIFDKVFRNMTSKGGVFERADKHLKKFLKDFYGKMFRYKVTKHNLKFRFSGKDYNFGGVEQLDTLIAILTNMFGHGTKKIPTKMINREEANLFIERKHKVSLFESIKESLQGVKFNQPLEQLEYIERLYGKGVAKMFVKALQEDDRKVKQFLRMKIAGALEEQKGIDIIEFMESAENPFEFLEEDYIKGMYKRAEMTAEMKRRGIDPLNLLERRRFEKEMELEEGSEGTIFNDEDDIGETIQNNILGGLTNNFNSMSEEFMELRAVIKQGDENVVNTLKEVELKLRMVYDMVFDVYSLAMHSEPSNDVNMGLSKKKGGKK